MGLVSITQLANGTTADATAVDANFNNIANVLNGNIDATNLAGGTIGASAYADGWTPLIGITPSSVTYNGNRSYNLVFNGVNLTTQISNGMRLKGTRTVTAPTQCTSLDGSTQYYSRASASLTGMTFTGSFTTMAWLKLASYPSGDAQIVGRTDNSTGGYTMEVKSDGRLRVFYGGASAFTDFISYQSVPLNKWTHVAFSVNSAAKTAVLLIDGVVCPTSSALTAATAVTQVGNFEIGRLTGGQFIPGKISQPAVFSTNVATATIQSYISQGLAGNETSLISAYSFNNSINDLNANANNLTANGSAVATNADSPFAGGANASTAYTAGTTEYGEVFAISFSTNTTVTVQVPDGYAIPTTGGVSAMSYSTQAAPLGWPLPSGVRELARVLVQSNQTTTSTTSAQILGLTATVYVPAGRTVKVSVAVSRMDNSGAPGYGNVVIWDGVVGSGIQVANFSWQTGIAANGAGAFPSVNLSVSGSKTYNAGFAVNGGTGTIQAAPTNPAVLLIELV